jgi:hypothetical protein
VARMLNQNGSSVSFSIIDISTLRASPRVGLAASVRSFVSMYEVSTAITRKMVSKKGLRVNRWNYLVPLSSLPANRGRYVSTEF